MSTPELVSSAFLEQLGDANNVTISAKPVIAGRSSGIRASVATKKAGGVGTAGKAKATKAAKPKKPVDEKKAKVLERNREAARRCRDKKKKQQEQFDQRATQLKASIGKKQTEIPLLKNYIAQLKEMLAQKQRDAALGGGGGGGAGSLPPMPSSHGSPGTGPAVPMGAFGLPQQAHQRTMQHAAAFLRSGGAGLVQQEQFATAVGGSGGGGGGAGTEISLNLEDDGLMEMLLRDIAGDSGDLLGTF